jgi:hypothetical protein
MKERGVRIAEKRGLDKSSDEEEESKVKGKKAGCILL